MVGTPWRHWHGLTYWGLRMVNSLHFRLCWNIPTLCPLKAKFSLSSKMKKQTKIFPLLITCSSVKKGQHPSSSLILDHGSELPNHWLLPEQHLLCSSGEKEPHKLWICSITYLASVLQNKVSIWEWLRAWNYREQALPTRHLVSELSVQELAVNTGWWGFYHSTPKPGHTASCGSHRWLHLMAVALNSTQQKASLQFQRWCQAVSKGRGQAVAVGPAMTFQYHTWTWLFQVLCS